MNRVFTFGLIALVGCGDSYNLTKIQTKMWVSPQMSDVGNVFIESEHQLKIQIDCLQGEPLDILGVDVQNIEGEFFAFNGELPEDIESGDSVLLDVDYMPVLTGYHRADIEVISSSVEGSMLVGVRGHAVIPEASRWPNVIDFGDIDAGSTKTLQLSIMNESAADLTLEELIFGDSVFSVLFVFDESL